MALFTERELETRVDPLTQFYQVEFPQDWRENPRGALEGSELDTWTARNARFEMREVIRGEGGNILLGPTPRHSEKSLRTLALFAELHGVLVQLMDAAADHENPSDDIVRAFNALARKHLEPTAIIWDKGNRKPLICNQRREGEEVYAAFLLDLFLDAVQAEAFSRCRQCNSVFVVRRTGARAPVYCSVRCRDRSSANSYYQRKKKSLAAA